MSTDGVVFVVGVIKSHRELLFRSAFEIAFACHDSGFELVLLLVVARSCVGACLADFDIGFVK